MRGDLNLLGTVVSSGFRRLVHLGALDDMDAELRGNQTAHLTFSRGSTAAL